MQAFLFFRHDTARDACAGVCVLGMAGGQGVMPATGLSWLDRGDQNTEV